jgi:putative transposase
MPRKPREDIENGLHHVFAHGIAGQLIFVEDVDRHIYLRMLARVIKRMGWRCLGYCLMGTHLHLLIETPRANLSVGMQRLQSGYAQDFNERRRRLGHLFQGRFGAVRITSDEQLVTVAAYIARNPVEAGLCERAEDWRWSSHAATQGLVTPPPWLDVARLGALLEGWSPRPLPRLGQLVAQT